MTAPRIAIEVIRSNGSKKVMYSSSKYAAKKLVQFLNQHGNIAKILTPGSGPDERSTPSVR